MNTRSMRAPRRIDTTWPQTVQVDRRTHRTRENPYRRRDTRQSGKHATDWIVLAMLAGVCWYLYGDLVVAFVRGVL